MTKRVVIGVVVTVGVFSTLTVVVVFWPESSLGKAINSVASLWVIAATLVLALLTYEYVRFTGQLVSLQAMPDIVVDVEFERGWLMYVVVKNAGTGPAKDVKIAFRPDLYNSSGNSIGELALFKQGIAFLPAGKQYRHLFDSANQFFSDRGPPEKRYVATVTYGVSGGEQRVIEQPLDLSVYADLHFAARSDLHDVAEQLRRIVTALERNRR